MSRPSPTQSLEVERFDPQIAGATEEGFLPMDQTVEGDWVRYSDYEKEKTRADELAATDEAQLENRILELEAERDEAANQERQRLEAECNEQAADFSSELEDAASLLASGGPRPDYDAIGDDLNRIACELDALQPAKIEARLSQERQRIQEALRTLAEAWENMAARRFRKLDALEVADYEPADFVAKGEGESFATAANALRDALDILDPSGEGQC